MSRNRPLRSAFDWFLLTGNRFVVAGIVFASTLALVFAVDPLGGVTGRNATPLFYAFSALLGGNLNLLTIVVSVNQIVLTRELKSPGQFQQEIDSIEGLREDVASATGERAVPTTPAAFVRDLLDAVDEQAGAVERAAQGTNDRLEADAGELADRVRTAIERARESLSGSVPVVDLVVVLTRIDVTETHHAACRLRDEHADALGEEGRAAFSRLASQTRLLVVTREHVQELFTRRNLSNLSRVLLSVGVVVEAILLAGLLAFVGVLGVGPFGSVPTALTYPTVTVGLVPLAVVFAYIVRSATIAYLTATTTQFVVDPGRD